MFFLFPSTQQSLTVLVPRVWPFLRHTIASVRRAALDTLFTLLSKADQVGYSVKYTNIYLVLACSIMYMVILIFL